MPSLQRLANRVDAKELAVVAVSVDDDLNLVREFLLRHGLRFPVYADDRRPALRDVLDVQSYPLTLLVARGGRIAERVSGERDWDSAQMRALIATKLQVPGAVAD